MAGEIAARRFLEKLGYEILESRFRVPIGEIDLVAREGKTLVFIEVKTRRKNASIPPEFSVTREKRRRIGRIARWYLAARKSPPEQSVRFDVVAVEEQSGQFSFRHLRGAFLLEGPGK